MSTAPLPPPDRTSAKDSMLHFATAFVFLLIGLSVLVWNSGRLAMGQFADPRVLGGLHFVTLGWLSLSIFGALRVFTGVALGSQGGAPVLGRWVRKLWTAGVLVFPLGLMLTKKELILPGLIFLTLALTLYTIYLAPALLRASRGSLTKWYLVVALISLWLALFLGAGAALLRSGLVLWTTPPGYFHAHVLVAVFGWVGAVVVGVGSHLIPMFALSRETSSWPVRLALPIWTLIPVLSGLGAFFSGPYLALGWLAAAAGSVLWSLQVVLYFKNRVRAERDPGLYLAAGSTGLLLIAWILAWWAGATVTFIGMVVIGWLTLFTLGIYHRVVPFLVWFSRYASGAGKGRVPKVRDLTSDNLGMVTLGLALLGALFWGLGLWIHSETGAYVGSTLMLLSALLALGQCRWLFGKPRLSTRPLPFLMKERSHDTH